MAKPIVSNYKITRSVSKCLLLCIAFCCTHTSYAQQKVDKDTGVLYSAGYASAFIGGLYDGYFPYNTLTGHGNFGLGAIDKMDGELTMLNGKIYQTRFTGKTLLLDKSAKIPYAVVCNFHAQKTFSVKTALDKKTLFSYLDSLITDQNGLYAIHIRGNFDYVKTRAFPPVAAKPYKPLAEMLNLQHFFEFNNTKGDLVGYRLPAYMEGPHISGYHFHFLTDKKDGGGHIIELKTDIVTIEVDKLTSFTVDLPQTDEFRQFDLKKDRKEEIKSVENGKKQ